MQEAWALQLWVEASAVAQMKYLIAKEVVTFSTVTPARAGEAMITVPVNNLIAEGAMNLRLVQRESEPTLDHCFEQKRIHMHPKSF